jgi:serine/threonine protein kinase
MAEAALSEWIAPDKIFSRDQFYFNDPVDLLGEGGFSQVFKALLKRDPRREWMKGDLFVAAKVLIGRRNNWSRIDQSQLRSLRKEAAILLSLEGHKNVVQLIGICQEPSCYALLLEYVPGGNLSRFVLSLANVTMDIWEKKLDISHQIAEGMCHLHSQSPPVLHLDLKLSNVLFRETCGGRLQCKVRFMHRVNITFQYHGATTRSSLSVYSVYNLPLCIRLQTLDFLNHVEFLAKLHRALIGEGTQPEQLFTLHQNGTKGSLTFQLTQSGLAKQMCTAMVLYCGKLWYELSPSEMSPLKLLLEKQSRAVPLCLGLQFRLELLWDSLI